MKAQGLSMRLKLAVGGTHKCELTLTGSRKDPFTLTIPAIASAGHEGILIRGQVEDAPLKFEIKMLRPTANSEISASIVFGWDTIAWSGKPLSMLPWLETITRFWRYLLSGGKLKAQLFLQGQKISSGVVRGGKANERYSRVHALCEMLLKTQTLTRACGAHIAFENNEAFLAFDWSDIDIAHELLVAGQVLRNTPKLADLGITVSTGRVVDFRARNALAHQRSLNCFPLIYPVHVKDGTVHWPKESKKPNYFCPDEEQQSQLVPAGFYVLTKRFSSKEEKRRIVAAVISPEVVSASHYALENHLNYFHQHGTPLPVDLAIGLAAFLNSTLADTYFRIYNGHTQVNASDLKAFRYPSVSDLKKLGQNLKHEALTTEIVDNHVMKLCQRYSRLVA